MCGSVQTRDFHDLFPVICIVFFLVILINMQGNLNTFHLQRRSEQVEMTKIKFEEQDFYCIVMITLYHYANKVDGATVDAVCFPCKKITQFHVSHTLFIPYLYLEDLFINFPIRFVI